MRAIDPYVIQLGDGKEYEFFASYAAIKRLSKAQLKEGGVTADTALDLLPQVLYDFCTNKGEMTLEYFESILPPDGAWIQAHIDAIRKHSYGAVSPFPPKASAVGDTPTTTGLESGELPAPSSD